jgi:two-component system, NarL family, invasion response regulator UvrY
MRRFLIADDHAIVRAGLKQFLFQAFPSAIIGEVTNTDDLYEKVTLDNWDLVISDISMPGQNALDILQQIRLDHPRLPVLILSAYSEDQYAIRALKAGASGYLSKEAAESELVRAIDQLLLGKKYITPSIAERLAATLDRDAAKISLKYLSNREFEVCKLLAVGKTISQIAEKIFLSVTTVSTYRTRIMAKLDLKNNADLTLYAVEHKLL